MSTLYEKLLDDNCVCNLGSSKVIANLIRESMATHEELSETSQKLEAYELISHAIGSKNKDNSSVYKRQHSSYSMTNLIGDSTSVSKNSNKGKMS